MYNLATLTDVTDRRSIKPDAGAQMDWTNGLTRNLCFYTNFSSCSSAPQSQGSDIYDFISRTRKYPNSTTLVTSYIGDLGVALSFTGATTSSVQWNVGTAPTTLPLLLANAYTSDNPFTAAVKFRCPTANGTANAILLGFPAAVNDRWHMGMAQTTGTARIKSLTSVTTTTATFIDGKWYTMFFRHIPGTTQIVTVYDSYGIIVEEASGATSNYSTGDATDLNLAANQTGGGGFFTGQIEWAGIWAPRFMSNVELQSIAVNPYQIFDGLEFKFRWQSAPAAAASFNAGRTSATQFIGVGIN